MNLYFLLVRRGGVNYDIGYEFIERDDNFICWENWIIVYWCKLMIRKNLSGLKIFFLMKFKICFLRWSCVGFSLLFFFSFIFDC